MSDVTIRPATRDDLPEVVHMLAAMVADMARAGGPTPADAGSVDRFFDDLTRSRIDDPSFRHVIAKSVDGMPAGTAAAEIRSLPEVFVPHRHLHVSAVYVAPELRMRGIGRRLVESLLDWGRTNGCESADLNVLVANPARSVYESLGFAATQVRLERPL